jgi:hypothetical protein
VVEDEVLNSNGRKGGREERKRRKIQRAFLTQDLQ